MADNINTLILSQAQNLAANYPTVDALAAFNATGTVNESNQDYLANVDGILPHAAPPKEPAWVRWADDIRRAICNDFNYCAKKAEVKADLNKFLPEIIKSLINNKVGQNGPSWLAPTLTALGFSAGWEAAVATVVAYCIVKGLDEWCKC